jgi:hypothetical protein
MTLHEYTQQFMKNMIDYRQSLIKLREWHPESQAIAKMLEKMKDEYQCDDNFESMTVEKFLEIEWVSFQMTIAYNLSKKFYGEDYVMRFIEFIDFRDMTENTLMDQRSDQSVYTRIVNNLKIPVDQIPKQFVQVLFSSDEFMFATNHILKVIHEEMDSPDKYHSPEEYRANTAEHADKSISVLHEKGYFGTYGKDYLTELMMAYRMGFTMIGPLYIASKIPKNPNKYEDLKLYVDKLWEQYKQQQQNGDGQ